MPQWTFLPQFLHFLCCCSWWLFWVCVWVFSLYCSVLFHIYRRIFSLFFLCFFSSPNNPPSHHRIFLGCNIKSALYFTHVRTHTEWESEMCNTQTTGEHSIFIRFVSLRFFWLLFLLSASVFVSRLLSVEYFIVSLGDKACSFINFPMLPRLNEHKGVLPFVVCVRNKWTRV